jgi:DNA ligase (NAD+)
MANPYHITPAGEAAPCRATADNCPFAGAAEHYPTAEAAREAYERAQAATLIHHSSDGLAAQRQAALELIEELSTAATAYYQQGEDSGLTDEEFDAKLDYLETLSADPVYSDLFSVSGPGFKLLENTTALGTEVQADAVVMHDHPMLSLDKAKKEPDLLAFLRKAEEAGAKNFRIQAKLDGLAISVKYQDGALVWIATRGDGQVGEDVTYLLKDPAVTVKGLPQTIDEPGLVEVRGELFFTTKQFEAADDARLAAMGSRFKNSRNAASGLLKKANHGVGYPVEFTYAAYSMLRDGAMIGITELEAKEAFVTVDALTRAEVGELPTTAFESHSALMAAVHAIGDVRPGFSIPTDGIVIKPTNEVEVYEAMGVTSHHPASQIAWKYPAEKAVTTVLGIDVSVGKSGRVTPIARVEPTHLAGSVLSNASLHNFNLVHTKGIRVGSVVMIEKANDIIPQVVAVISSPAESADVPIPTVCPSCGGALAAVGAEWPPKTLNCGNSACPSRASFALKTAVGKNFLDIDGLSEVTLAHLTAIGRITDIADLYTLTEEELANSEFGVSTQGNPRRLGEKRAKHILAQLEKSKSKPLTKVLPALSIHLLGQTSSKLLLKHFGSLDAIMAASVDELASLDKIGPIRAQKIADGLQEKAELIARLQSHGVEFAVPVTIAPSDDASETDSGAALSGLSFAISGAVPQPFANRGAWVDYVESKGGTFHSGPKADTSFMVGEASENSAKIKKAHSLGVAFITAADFTARYV